MFFIALFASFLSSCLTQITTINPVGCGVRPAVASNVVNGNSARHGAHPWIALMKYGTGSTKSFICGGALINQQWIVTAAHCVSDVTASYYSFDLGLTNRNNPESSKITVGVSKVIKHPSYNSLNLKNDIALMKLSSAVSISGSYIRAICLPNTTLSGLSGSVLAAGWGALSYQGSTASTLQEIVLPVVSDSTCAATYIQFDKSCIICAGEKGRSTCQGDSGGPVVGMLNLEHFTLIGLNSFGQNCDITFGVKTRVGAFVTWIQSVISNN